MPPPAWAVKEAERARARADAAFSFIAAEASRRQDEEEARVTTLRAEQEAEEARVTALRAEQEAHAASASEDAAPAKRQRVASESWEGWDSGEDALKEALRRGRWPDGARVGKGHVRPYLQPVYARAIADRSKPVEGRPVHGWAKLVQTDDYVNFNISGSGPRLVVRVTGVRRFGTFSQMLQEVGIHACLPGFDGDLRAATQLYRSFGSSAGSYADLEREHGVAAVDVVPVAALVADEPKGEQAD